MKKFEEFHMLHKCYEFCRTFDFFSKQRQNLISINLDSNIRH